jgi:cytochrome b involved in lipid metabolism
VESLLAITPEAQAQVDIKQASRRLEEADKLSSAGKLDSKTSDELKNNFAGSIESLSRSLEDLRGAGASTTVSRLRNGWKSEVDNHYDSFVAISSVSTSSSATTSPNTQILWNKDGEQNNERSGDDNKKVELRRGSSNNASEVRGRIIENEGSTGDNEGDDESDDREGSISKPITPVSTTTQTQVSVKNFTLTQVALHHTKGDCYSAVSGSVYDLTSWIAAHPGGQSAIVGMCGIDATQSFMSQHAGQARPEQELASFKIGVLVN